MKENGSPYKPTVRLWYLVYWMIAIITKNSGKVQTKIARAGEIAAWSRYLGRRFPNEKINLYRDKDVLRRSLFAGINTSEKVIALELGVAYGKGSKWIIDNLSTRLLEFHGFDRFTGLPRAWRGLNKGHFSTNGVPPTINDERVFWHVGNAEETLREYLADKDCQIKVAKKRVYRLIVIFDLDILEPTLVCYETLRPFLECGDLVHFDEAFDAENEQLVLEQFLKDFNVTCIGYTCEAASFKILDKKLD